jgi:hypothetical protein
MRARANQVLSGFGLRVSWDAMGEVLESGPRRIGKASVLAAALTVAQYAGHRGLTLPARLFTYREAREFMARARGWRELLDAPPGVQSWVEDHAGDYACVADALQASRTSLVEDFTDGVVIYVDPTTETHVHGITVVRGWGTSPRSGSRRTYLVRGGGRTYHYPTYLTESPRDAVRDAVRDALKAWKRQRILDRECEREFMELLPADRSVLVSRQDSIRAGNCAAGTEAFALANGWRRRECISVAWLLPFAADPAVRRVLRLVSEEVSHAA